MHLWCRFSFHMIFVSDFFQSLLQHLLTGGGEEWGWGIDLASMGWNKSDWFWKWGMVQLAPEWVSRSQRINFGWKWGRTSQSVGGTLGSWQDMRWDFLQQIICLKLAPVSSVRTPHHQHYHKQLHHLRWWHMPTSVGRSVNRNGEDFPATDEDIPLLWPCTRFTDGDRRDNLGDERAMVMVMIHWRNQLCCRPSPKSFRVICSSIAKRGLKGLFTNF